AIDSVENYKTDLRVLLVSEGGGRVHQGFRDALDLVWADVSRRIGDERGWFAGHSLGAALATLAAARHGRAGAVFAYGAPRPGDAAYRDAYETPLYRFVNRDDIVTQLPPPLGYRHIGALRYFDGDGLLHDEPDVRSRAADVARRWFSGQLRELPKEAFLDHAPIRYAQLCLKNVAPAR
ncbi:MAG: hypothetical protein OER88_05860, partial [Planctomycetota bacterium]|nr:hypothetical protein [Planctomycetota bacterium]